METEVIIIGAGISGLAAAKCMKDVGFDVSVLESTSDVGGLWTYRENNYGVMKFTHINVSKFNYCFSDFPPSDKYPDYMHNAELAEYIWDYTKHFKLEEVIKFNRQVTSVKRRDADNKWVLEVQVTEVDPKGEVKVTEKKETHVCTFLAVASGHHSKPAYPNFPGQDTFTGQMYHSIDYKDAEYNKLNEKKVVIVGVGNSAVDVAVNATEAGRCKPVYLSTRSGAWVAPNYVFGHPTDLYANRMFLSLPHRVGSFIMEMVISSLQGHPNKWGLKPKMHALQTQPTVSPTLIHHIQRGNVKVVPNIQKINKNTVTFDDGTSTEADVIITCTGYNIDLPFLDDDVTKHFLNKQNNSISLYKNVFAPDLGHNLAFIGFTQPASGGLLSMSEIQARWWAELCRNNILLPMRQDMRKSIDEDYEYVKSRWFASNRHTIQRDPILYTDEIASFIGAKPLLKDNPRLAWRLVIGSCGAAQWRLQGPGKWNKAAETVKKVPVTEMMHYGTIFTILLVLFLYFWFISFICGLLF